MDNNMDVRLWAGSVVRLQPSTTRDLSVLAMERGDLKLDQGGLVSRI